MDKLKIAKKTFSSRLIVGTGKYNSMKECAKAIKISGAEIVTVAVRRVNISDKNKPLQNIVERQLQLKAVKWIDEIVVYHREHELEDIFYTFPIDIRIIGEEYKDKVFTGRQVCKDRKIEIYYNKRGHSFSTTELRNRNEKEKTEEWRESYKF